MKNVIQGTTLSGTGAVSIAPGAEITIRNPAGQLVPLWADRAGTQPHDNPFLTDNEGNFRVYADSGWVHVRAQKDGSVREWRYVPLGSAAAMDIGEVYEALGAEVYSSLSEGLSNSAEGDFFLIESSGSLDLYRVVNGVAEQRAAGIDDNAILATRAYADGVAAEAESNATNSAVAAASSAYQQATEYSDSQLQTHRESGDHDHRYYTKQEVDQALDGKVDEGDPRLSNAREWTAETVSQAEAEAGTSTTRRAWTAQRVRQAIVAGYNALTSVFGRTLANASDATAARNTLGLGTAATRDVGTGANNVVVGSDARLSDAREWTAEVVSQSEAEAGTSSVPRKWTAERVRQAIEALGGGGIDPGDLGTAATRDVTTSPTDTTAGRVLTVGAFGLGRYNDLRNTIYVTGAPKDLYGKGYVIGFTDGSQLSPPIGTSNNYGTLEVKFQWKDSSGRLACSRTFTTADKVFVQRAVNDDTWGPWRELASTDSLLGVGQTWQDVTSQRAIGVNYTNTTGRPIFVVATCSGTATTMLVNLIIDSTPTTLFDISVTDWPISRISVNGIVPPGSTYRVHLSGDVNLTGWRELR